MHTVITTINNPTSCVVALASSMKECGGRLIVCGDKKSPVGEHEGVDEWRLACDTEFLSLKRQKELDYGIVKSLPEGHYSRKNIGYLRAMQVGSNCIYETDDDNQPNEFWKPRQSLVIADTIPASKQLNWINAYRLFTRENIWPRGFPLDKLAGSLPQINLDSPKRSRIAPVQQGLANIAPDVDAVWRLTAGREFSFPNEQKSFLLEKGNWCPFNTQSTWWWPESYLLLYVPSHCPFRMCDIWKSFVAQRCLWEFADGIVFHSPEVDQLRNPHNLMADFEGELQGYLRNHEICKVLHGLNLRKGIGNLAENMIVCYEALVKIGIFPSQELALLGLWIEDCHELKKKFA